MEQLTYLLFIKRLDELHTIRGIMEASALYESPFSNLHASGPDEFFAKNKNVIDGVFQTLESLASTVRDDAG